MKARSAGTATSTHGGFLRAGVVLAAALALLGLPSTASAQDGLAWAEWDVPSFHVPAGEDGYGMYVTFPQDMDAVGAVGTWRASGEYVDLGVRGGVVNIERPTGDDAVGFSFGADFKNELVSAYEEFPLDVSWASGIGASLVPEVDRAAVRVPLGLVVGREIQAENVVITPYAYPRLALDFLFRDEGRFGPAGGDDETDLRMDLDFGADLRVDDEWSVRVGFTVGRQFTAGAGLTF